MKKIIKPFKLEEENTGNIIRTICFLVSVSDRRAHQFWCREQGLNNVSLPSEISLGGRRKNNYTEKKLWFITLSVGGLTVANTNSSE